MMSDGTNGLPHLGNGGILTAMAPNDKGKMLPLEAAPDIQTFLQTNKVRTVFSKFRAATRLFQKMSFSPK